MRFEGVLFVQSGPVLIEDRECLRISFRLSQLVWLFPGAAEVRNLDVLHELQQPRRSWASDLTSLAVQFLGPVANVLETVFPGDVFADHRLCLQDTEGVEWVSLVVNITQHTWDLTDAMDRAFDAINRLHPDVREAVFMRL